MNTPPSDKEEFRAATDRLMGLGMPLTIIGEAMGVALNTVGRWRSPTDPRTPFAGWRRMLALGAAEAAAKMRENADALDACATELGG